MRQALLLLLLAFAACSHGQRLPMPVCELFRDLPSHNGQVLQVRGEVVISSKGPIVGADPLREVSAGRTALDHARTSGKREVIGSLSQ